jgi:DNA primase
MKFPPSFLDEIRARLPVSEVVGARVRLKKQGREWRGLSPFQSEKTPSFYVNDQKGFYHDFSSGKHGDAFSFLMETEGLSFPEAVERLAGMAGLQMPVETEESVEREKKRATLGEVLELAALWFEAQLQDRAGAKARGYLADRGLTPAIQKDFRLGYGPNEKYALRDHLAGRGASVDTMIEAGLLIHGEDIAVPYDRFRDRVMFPICDRAGRVIAFGGRAMDKNAQAKYLNSPETSLFHKGACLYNHHRARKAAHDAGNVIAVEGYVDVISMSVAGFPQTVAPLGTALTADQCDLLWKMSEEPILCFDGDKAGRKAAYRALDTALPLIGPGKTLRFALLPEGEDPDDLARSGGAPAISAVLAAAKPFVDMLWLRETEDAPIDTPERRAALERRLYGLIRDISDEGLRRHYSDALRERFQTLFGRDRAAPRAGWQGERRPPMPGRGGRAGRFAAEPPLSSPVTPSASLLRSSLFAGAAAIAPREAYILLILMNHPGLVSLHVEELSHLDFASRDARAMLDRLLISAAEPLSPEALAQAVDRAGLAGVRQRLAAMDAHASLWSVRSGAAQADADEALRQALVLHRKAKALHRELQLAETALAQEASELNYARLCDIREQLTGLAGAEAAIEGFGALSGRDNRPI